MNKLATSIICLAVMALSFSILNAQSDNDTNIVIIPANSTETTIPNRCDVPISAMYDAASCSLIVWFSQNLGLVDFSLYCFETGNTLETTINAYGAPAIFPVLQSGCSYMLLFTLPNGDAYYGEFEL